MAKTIGKLTALQVDSLGPGLHSDGANLYLRVNKDGNRSWVLIYQFGGRRREAGGGKAGKGGRSLKDARQWAAEGREMVARQIDPLTIWRAPAPATVPTFAQCANKYLERQTSRGLLGKNQRHQGQWRTTLARLPVSFRNLPIDKIGPREVFEALDPIWTKTPETASRLRGRIASVLDFARDPDDTRETRRLVRLVEAEARYRRNTRQDRSQERRARRAQSLSRPALQGRADFVRRLRADDSVAARGLEFILLTAARSKEVRFAKWSEIDTAARTWTVPWQRLKTGKRTKTDHVVPLSDRMLAIISEMSKTRISDYVFPGRYNDQPLGEMAFFDLLAATDQDRHQHAWPSQHVSRLVWRRDELSARACRAGARTHRARRRGRLSPRHRSREASSLDGRVGRVLRNVAWILSA